MPANHNTHQFKDLLRLLEYRAATQPNQQIYRFLVDKKNAEPEEITNLELATKARQVAFLLINHGVKHGDRILINHFPGIRYIISFFATLYAGGIAVPVYPPRFNTRMDRISIIVKDSGAKIALTSSLVTKSMVLDEEEDLKHITWIETDVNLNSISEIKDFELPSFSQDDMAFMQYTSGSTSSPKGVMLTHGSLLANLQGIYHKFEIDPQIDHGVIWLPPYHDMGFIGGILVPLYSGFGVTLMSPFTFIQRPLRWLEAINKYRGTISGGPNFAYDQCVRRIRDSALESLDLSSWRVAFCGAEPIRPDILSSFSNRFSIAGFKEKALYPCYGLAESTLIVTGGKADEKFMTFDSDCQQLESEHIASLADENNQEKKRIRSFVACGSALANHDVRIVHHETKELCSDGHIGEVWVSGPSVAKGYWKRTKATVESFQATYVGQENDKKYLRTGDLGFIKNNEIYITGRIKDMLIIRGKNFYPQDIEISVNQSHKLMKLGVGAVFSITKNEEEHVMVLSEVSENIATEVLDEVIEAIESRIFEDHGLSPGGIHLLKPSSIPFTSSGKVMRQASKKIFLAKGFNTVKAKGIHNEEII